MSAPKIFESPDKGVTIYSREAGSAERATVREDLSTIKQLLESKMWSEIRRSTNPAMVEYRERCVELYHLLKDERGRLPE
jgi:hypothetical protein